MRRIGGPPRPSNSALTATAGPSGTTAAPISFSQMATRLLVLLRNLSPSRQTAFAWDVFFSFFSFN